MKRAIKELKGVGPVKALALSKNNINTIGDLLEYFPRRYLDRTITEAQTLTTGTTSTLIVRVVNSYLAHGRRSRLLVHCRTMQEEALTLVFFRNARYFQKVFKNDQNLIVSGKIEYYRGFQLAHPDFEQLDGSDASLIHVGRIIPLYSSSDTLKKAGLDSRGFRRLIAVILEDSKLEVIESLPAEVIKKYDFSDRQTALRNIHFPENEATLERARQRLKYEELFLFHYLMLQKRRHRKGLKKYLRPYSLGKSESYKKLIASLPFNLTNEQKRTIKEIMQLCSNDSPEAFLLQGDVGSGKTVVALCVALHYIDNQIQTAIMAPTEVLARQHYRTLIDLLGFWSPVHLEIITGQDKKKNRLEALERIASGDANLVIGTHSLLEESVQFKSLGLVIVDEQHRFGVEQREILRNKGRHPDLIVMTATPIPRTLCLTGFADLHLITLKEKPAGRKPVETMWLNEDRRNGMYKSITKHISRGRQCYIVYPLIEESEKLDLRSATEAYQELKTTQFAEFNVALLHGRMKSVEKDRIMTDFRTGKIQILVSTTVIEVGIDVPNATIMVIEHSERFGISQLHQLRGRVGRGEEKSFCVLMTEKTGEEATIRLKAIEESNDGFYLAEVDMKLRGPGELLGLRQHGLPGFQIADLVLDQKIAEQAHTDVRNHPNLNDEALRIIRHRFPEGSAVFTA